MFQTQKFLEFHISRAIHNSPDMPQHTNMSSIFICDPSVGQLALQLVVDLHSCDRGLVSNLTVDVASLSFQVIDNRLTFTNLPNVQSALASILIQGDDLIDFRPAYNALVRLIVPFSGYSFTHGHLNWSA